MLQTLKNAWKIPDLRKRMIFTFMMLVIYRIGAAIPVPGMNTEAIQALFASQENGILGFFDVMAGGAFSQFTIFALSIYPYVTASIIVQLLTIALPSWELLAREGEAGRKKMAQRTRIGTVIFALVQAFGISIGLFNRALIDDTFMTKFTVIIVLTAGTAFLMWLGEQITTNGIGNGISLIIFTGIISRMPGDYIDTFKLFSAGTVSLIELILFFTVSIAVIAGVVAIQEGSRKIPVQYSKRVVGRKLYGGQSTHIPLKVLMAGVIPVIFSTSVLAFLPTIGMFFPNSGYAGFVNRWLAPTPGEPGIIIYTILNFGLIVFFTYFYTAIQFNPVDYADNLKKYGGFIPGRRPGKPTAEYLSSVVNRITLLGAIALGLIAVLPTVISTFTNLNIAFGGTSLIIIIGVALETFKQIEAQMLQRHYKGFLK